jgi:hypothetical protein
MNGVKMASPAAESSTLAAPREIGCIPKQNLIVYISDLSIFRFKSRYSLMVVERDV